jgi:hypothetical protein
MAGIISPAGQTSWPYADCTSSSERERPKRQRMFRCFDTPGETSPLRKLAITLPL